MAVKTEVLETENNTKRAFACLDCCYINCTQWQTRFITFSCASDGTVPWCTLDSDSKVWENQRQNRHTPQNTGICTAEKKNSNEMKTTR